MNLNVFKGIVVTLVLAVGLVNIYLHDNEIGASNNLTAVADVPVETPTHSPLPEVVTVVEPQEEPVPELPVTTPEPVIEDEPELPEPVIPEPEPTPEPVAEDEPEPVIEDIPEEPTPALPDLPPSWLNDMIVLLDGGLRSREGDATMGGALFPEFHRWIESRSGDRTGIYYLGGRYSRLEAMWENTSHSGAVTLEIFADDRMIYTQVSAGNQLLPISVDVTNVLRLRIVFSYDRAATNAIIWNPMLVPNPDFVPAQSVFAVTGIPTWLVSIAPVNNPSNIITLNNTPGTSNTGELFSNHISRSVNSGNFAADWRLDGSFKRLTGVYTIPQGGSPLSLPSTLIIELDDVEVFSVTLNTGDLPVFVDIDISGATKLTIRLNGLGSATLRSVFANVALFE